MSPGDFSSIDAVILWPEAYRIQGAIVSVIAHTPTTELKLVN